MNPTLTDEVVGFLLNQILPPKEVREKAIEHVLDGFAVMLAGSRTDCAKKLADFVHEKGGVPTSTIIGFDFKTTPQDAAMINGTSGHADDYDDTQLSTSPDRIYGLLTHPTVPVLAAALAVGEQMDCSGEEFLDAFVAGFEVECKLAEAIKPEHYRRGFHTTGTMGAFGAFAASGRLLGLDEQEYRHALGITASLSSGIRVNFGTMTKPLHAGMAASNGVTACMLAKRGFTSDRNALDGPWGYMQILGNGYDPDMIVGKLDDPYALIYPGATFKLYPCGSLGQPSMDTLLEIVTELDLGAKDVREVRLRAGLNILEPLRYAEPVNDLQAKFSLQFGLASILLRRKAGLREYTTEFVNRPKVRETMRKVKTVLDPELARMGVEKMRSVVEVELQDGRVVRRLAEKARGTPEKPLKGHELEDKFRECASFVLDEEKTDRVLKTIRGIEKLPSIEELSSQLIRMN
ncbi:MAG: MmgE/PrpD family protein [Candidatus Bathyarchaeota archaeon]|nr:MmgE/PrpD family protein [Candidatus Bathyarchaeota archaeon]